MHTWVEVPLRASRQPEPNSSPVPDRRIAHIAGMRRVHGVYESTKLKVQIREMRTAGLLNEAPPTSRRQNAYDTILYAIVFGELAPGSRLDEKSLARDLDIGIAGVRDALFRLSLERLVTRQPRTGTVVAGLDVQELQDVYEARIIMECQAARIAAIRANAQDLATLRKLTDEYMEIVELRDFRKLFKLDQTFHRAIARATTNRILEQDIVVLHNNASRFWYAGAVARLDQSDWISSRQAHVAVIDRIEAKDPRGAEKAMRRCIGQYPGFVDFYARNTELYEFS